MGSESRSWMPRRMSTTVMVGTQSFASSKMDKHTLPLGYTLGWNSGGLKVHFGGFEGYSAVKVSSSLYVPPSQGVCRLGAGGAAVG